MKSIFAFSSAFASVNPDIPPPPIRTRNGRESVMVALMFDKGGVLVAEVAMEVRIGTLSYN
jgi:hypothetical protein